MHTWVTYLVWPVIQSHQWLDLTPIPVDLGEKEFYPTQKHRVKIVSKLITGISTETGIMENAAERLLGLSLVVVRDLAFGISEGCMRSVVKELGAEAIKSDPDSLVDLLGERLNSVFKDVGLKIINLDVVKNRGHFTGSNFVLGRCSWSISNSTAFFGGTAPGRKTN